MVLSIGNVMKDAHGILAVTSQKAGDLVQTTPASQRFAHWSMYLLIINGCAAFATALAVALMGIRVLAVVICVIAVCSFIGAYYIKKFAVVHGLSFLLSCLTARVKEIFENNKTLKQTQQDFTQKIKDLEEARKKDNEIRAQQIKELDTKTKELDAALQKVKEQEEQRNKVEQLLKDTKQETEETLTKAQRYIEDELALKQLMIDNCATNTRLKDNIESVFKDAQNLAPIQQGFTQSILQVPNTQKQMAKLIAYLTTNCKTKNALIKQMNQEIGRLSILKPQLDKTVQSSTVRTAALKNVASALNNQAKMSEAVGGRLEDLFTLARPTSPTNIANNE